MKAADHARITAEAVRQFVRMSPSPSPLLLLQHTSLVQKGSEDPDNTPFYSRATNWHFYNRNLDRDVVEKKVWSFQEPVVFHLSSDHILQERVEQLSREVDKRSVRDCCLLVGRILHHIQDMSTPSHVVPVFHGPQVPDSFESYLNTSYLNDYGTLTASSVNLPTLIPVFEKAREYGSVMNIYQSAAQETLEFLDSTSCPALENGIPRQLNWNCFWSPQESTHPDALPSECTFSGFGSFGPLGKHFGVTDDIEVRENRYRISRESYRDFCRHRVDAMLTWSMQTLYFLAPELEKLG